MKRIIFIAAFLILAFSGFSQRGFVEDSIRVPNGADTTVYWYFWTEDPWGMSVQYSDFDDTDAVLTLGESGNTTDGTIFNQLDNASLPHTMADSTVAFEKMSFNFRYLAIKLTKNSVTAGLYMQYQFFRDDKPTLITYVEPMPGKIEYLVDSSLLFALK